MINYEFKKFISNFINLLLEGTISQTAGNADYTQDCWKIAEEFLGHVLNILL